MGFRNGYYLMNWTSHMHRCTCISRLSMCTCSGPRGYKDMPFSSCVLVSSLIYHKPIIYNPFNPQRWQSIRFRSNALVTLNTDDDVARFSVGIPNPKPGFQSRPTKKRKMMSRKAKLNELKWYRLKAKKKMKSPNPEVRIRYKLEKV